MKCPTCPDDTLVMTERSGIEIDYCPTCRGVWLDRGELDKIIERSVAPSAAVAPPAPSPPPRERADRTHDDRRGGRDPGYDDRYDDRGGRKPKRRESLLSELFDF